MKITTRFLGSLLLSGVLPASVALAAPKTVPAAVKVLETEVPAGLAYDGDEVKVTDAKRFHALGKIETTFMDPKHETNSPEDVDARKAKIIATLSKQVAKLHGNVLVITSWFRRGDIDPVTNKERESFDKVGAEGMAIQDVGTAGMKVAAAAAGN